MASTTTTTRKRATPSASSSASAQEANPRLELAKAINAITQKMEGFEKAAEALKAHTKDTLVDFDMQIQAKNEDLNRLTEEMEHAKKRGKTETELFLQEFRYEGAKKIIAERHETTVPTVEYEQMKATIAKLTAERDKEIEAATKAERDRSKAAMEQALKMQELSHKAQSADLTATTSQQIKEIESLKQTIANLKDEVGAQRKLTEAVAMASRQAPITLTTTGK